MMDCVESFFTLLAGLQNPVFVAFVSRCISDVVVSSNDTKHTFSLCRLVEIAHSSPIISDRVMKCFLLIMICEMVR